MAIIISHSHFVHVTFVSILVFQTFDRISFGRLSLPGTVIVTGVREGILLGGRKNFALKITIGPESNVFSLIRMGPETSCNSVLYS